MQTFGAFLVALLSASMAAGGALPKRDGGVPGLGDAHQIDHVPNPDFVDRSGPIALERAYLKYGAHVSDKLKAAANGDRVALATRHQKRLTTGSATATPNAHDREYLVPVKIGTPAQTLNLDFDTGSSDLWVFSGQQPASQTKNHHPFIIKNSSTAKVATGETWSILYGDGSTSSGNVYYDKVQIGNLTVTKQAVECAKTVSSQFVADTNDGLVGLAFPSLNTVSPDQQSTFFINILSQLKSHLFTADLKHAAAGSYLFGGIPSAATNIHYAPVDESNGFWQFDTSVDEVGAFSTIADTGTSLILGDADLINYYWDPVKSAFYDQDTEGIYFNCTEKLPNFSFSVGSGTITVPGSYINYAPAGGPYCYGGIQLAPDNIDHGIMGDVALKSAYVVFDAHNRRVGWSQKVKV